ncbi:C-3 sterol dehydrogenase [Punctularia strigosozonata HHB-11173 SS5]|uniref:C-3 sterol dehydrogenase n=1 Tax=Punctularia strigosozonata (strain HHB-11173) TaxID=741275 RepID=UPI000441755C|nr:C-3 sterol dehydrogenase [Punctularia strigosozonata HHB-11173 SS5]EIN12772.1 C-3 sterol dehydrogenase [Punctularia strigosozonata HHB-11173 SS5]
MAAARDTYLVIGGSGFLGRHIVEQLVARGDTVSVFDIVQRYDDVPCYTGDISEEGQVKQAVQKSAATCIIHTASPMHGLDDAALYWKVNVEGTKCVIEAAVACGVRKLVFTSSAGVVFNGEDLINIDERIPSPEKAMDGYNESKAKAEEMVLAANGKDGLLTVALRPSGIFGPGDRQVMHGLYQVYQNRQTHFQIGDNTNLFDWTYVTNVAHAHLLAADKLVDPTTTPTPSKADIVDYPLPSMDITTGVHRIPTSQARPLGPCVNPPPNADQLVAAFQQPFSRKDDPRPVTRSRFDPLADAALERATVNPLQVAGQVFFITNGEPIYFWDLPRAVWRRLAESDPERAGVADRRLIKLSRDIGLLLAAGSEWWGWLIGKEPAFTRFRVKFSCANRWHNIEKARRVLGYEPQVGIEEGVKRMVDWFISEHVKKQ